MNRTLSRAAADLAGTDHQRPVEVADRLYARDLLNASGYAYDAAMLATVARLLPIIRADIADRLRSECAHGVGCLMAAADRVADGTVGTIDDWTVE